MPVVATWNTPKTPTSAVLLPLSNRRKKARELHLPASHKAIHHNSTSLTQSAPFRPRGGPPPPRRSRSTEALQTFEENITHSSPRHGGLRCAFLKHILGSASSSRYPLEDLELIRASTSLHQQRRLVRKCKDMQVALSRLGCTGCSLQVVA